MRWLRDSAGHCYDYLVDVTAVEYRDAERPIELVYFLRSLERRGDLRVKGELPQRTEEHTAELQSQSKLVCRLLLLKKKNQHTLERHPRRRRIQHDPSTGLS